MEKMEEMMQLENWKTMLDTVPVEEWPVYIEKADQRTTDRLFTPKGSYISQISFYSMGRKMSRKQGCYGIPPDLISLLYYRPGEVGNVHGEHLQGW